jgi:hypothetical protein
MTAVKLPGEVWTTDDFFSQKNALLEYKQKSYIRTNTGNLWLEAQRLKDANSRTTYDRCHATEHNLSQTGKVIITLWSVQMLLKGREELLNFIALLQWCLIGSDKIQ